MNNDIFFVDGKGLSGGSVSVGMLFGVFKELFGG